MVARAAAASLATEVISVCCSRSSSGQPPEIRTMVLSPRTELSAPSSWRIELMLVSDVICAPRQVQSARIWTSRVQLLASPLERCPPEEPPLDEDEPPLPPVEPPAPVPDP